MMALRVYYVIFLAGLFSSLVQTKNAELSPYCSQVLNENNFMMLANAVASTGNADVYYSVGYTDQKMLYATCDITYTHALRIRFRKVTKITNILIKQEEGIKQRSWRKQAHETLELSLLKGGNSSECKRSGTSNISGLIYANFACSPEAFANAMEIKSSKLWTVDLTSFQKHERLEWLVLLDKKTQGCYPPGLYPEQSLNTKKTFFLPGEKVKFSCDNTDFEIKSIDTVKCDQTGFWSNGTPLCQQKPKWYHTKYQKHNESIGSSTAVGNKLNNASYVITFPKRGYINITKIIVIFSISLNQSEQERVLRNNMGLNVLNFSDVIYNEFVYGIEYPANFTSSNSLRSKNVIAPECMNCSIKVTFLNNYWDFDIIESIAIEATSTFESSEEGRKISNSCAPIQPYPGMPQSYLNYELVSKDSINELLRETPCREGFKLKCLKDNIVQCSNGKWIGKSFPVCEVIRTNSPPEVTNATWRYVHNDVFHEIVYTCDDGRTVNAKYDFNSDDWKIETDCQLANEFGDLTSQEFYSLRYLVIIVVGILTFASISVVVAYSIRLKTRRKESLPPTSPVSTENSSRNKACVLDKESRCSLQLEQDERSVYEELVDFNAIVSGSTETQHHHLYANVILTANSACGRNQLSTLEQELPCFSQLQQDEEHTYEETFGLYATIS